MKNISNNTGLEKNILAPKLRFPEFSGTWEKKKLGEVATKINSGKTPLGGESVYVPEGVTFIRSQNINSDRLLLENVVFISPSVNSTMKNSVVKPKDILLNITGASLGRSCVVPLDFEIGNVNQHVCIVRLKNENSPWFLQPIFSSFKGQKLFCQLQTGSGREGLNFESIRGIKLHFPTLPEQQKIASFLTAVDDKLQALKKKKAGLERYKKGITQKFFSQKLRFKDENGKNYPDWEIRKFSEVLKEHKLKSTGKEEVHSVSVHKGVINQIEHLGRSFSAKDTSHYSRALPNDIIYTKSPTGDFPLGIIKQNHIKQDVILSPLYGVFTPETKELGYMLHVYFESPINTSNYLSSIIQKGAKNTINITNDTFLSKKMLLPISKEEQTKIANFLSSIDDKIQQVERQLAGMEQWKKGLLQQLFV
jgi:type I restriction enzyme S subunit